MGILTFTTLEDLGFRGWDSGRVGERGFKVCNLCELEVYF